MVPIIGSAFFGAGYVPPGAIFSHGRGTIRALRYKESEPGSN
jgi:hypothetical protein